MIATVNTKERRYYRRESKRIDGDPEKGGYIWPIVEGVKSLKFEYWDETKEIGTNRGKSWNSHENENEPLLPSRVRIIMELANR